MRCKMKKLALPITVAVAFFLVACGDTVENVYQTGLEVFASEDDLPECTDENEGEQAFVKGESAVRICIDGDWVPMKGSVDTVFVNTDKLDCKTVELKDKSGLKIVCNGDSIGVVLNGSDGKDAVLPQDTLEADSERVAISLDSLVGVTQKGPFLKGSTVYLYELSDGRTLKQTNGNFTSNITSDDGRYKFTARDLVSQYAMVVVDGYYRNEVTGKTSDAPIRLKAITDMRKRSSVNVNILTQLEFDRVYSLVTRGGKDGKKLTVKQAKRQAQKEILRQFHIELDDNADAEDMDVFGNTDADAALLAVSVLLQGDSNETALAVLLSGISNAIEQNGEWNDSAMKARLADWALKADADNRLALFRKNVAGWHLSDTVPEFEKFVRNYVGMVSGLGVCGSDTVAVNTAVNITKPHSSYYAETFAGGNSGDSKVRFICKTDGGARWRIATDLEKDTLGWTHDTLDGAVRNGQINTNQTYVFDYAEKAWRHGTSLDSIIGLPCIRDRFNTMIKTSDNVWYRCVDSTMRLEEYEWNGAWRRATTLEIDTLGWTQNAVEGTFRNGQINSNFTYVFEKGAWRHGTSLDSILGLSCIQSRKDTLLRASAVEYYKCVGDTAVSFEESNWTSVWRKALDEELDMDYWQKNRNENGLLLKSPYTGKTMVWDAGVLREPILVEQEWNKACVSYMYRSTDTLSNGLAYTCSDTGWSRIGTFRDNRDGKIYKGVKIGTQTWMAQNLNFEYTMWDPQQEKEVVYGNFCYDNDPANCDRYGRFYQWGAAMDSAGDNMNPGWIYARRASLCGYDVACTPTPPVLGVCPDGWHLPTKAEFMTLFSTVGGESSADYVLKSQTGWDNDRNGNNGNGIDAYGFSVLPGGWRRNDGRNFLMGSQSNFWTSTEFDAKDAYSVSIESRHKSLLMESMWKYYGFFVRCVKD